jgi:hypothetical protein
MRAVQRLDERDGGYSPFHAPNCKAVGRRMLFEAALQNTP